MKNRNSVFIFLLLFGLFNPALYKKAFCKNYICKDVSCNKPSEHIKKELSLSKVIESSQKNYPQILNYYEKISVKGGEILESKGFFDIKIKNQYNDKTRGFYDGKINDIAIEKQIGSMGSKIYGGYRKSFGSFADYDGDNYTNNGGEYRVGGSLSLLKNRDIDSQRLDLIIAEFGLKESKIQLEKLRYEIARDATKSYWNWVIAGHIYQLYLDLYDLAKKRDEQLKVRYQKGDISQIILTENHRNVLQRRSLKQEAKNNFDNSALALSIYYRDEGGEMILATFEELPKIDFDLKNNPARNIEKDFADALERRPELLILKLQNQQEVNSLKQAQNLYQPKLDLQFETSKDLGQGTQSRSQANNKVKLDFELPFQQNLAKGKIAASSSKIKAIQYEEMLYRDKIKIEINQLDNSLKNILQIYENYLEELNLSKLLENAEKERFKHGNSDFFLINLREQEVASAKINKFIAFLKYQTLSADYKLAIFK